MIISPLSHTKSPADEGDDGRPADGPTAQAYSRMGLGAWSAELNPGVYEIFASSSVPDPIAFSGQELLVSGYEHTWYLTC